MISISLSDAINLVRANLDELDNNGSIMYNDEGGSVADMVDNRSLNDLIAHFLPEAINAVNKAAPVALLEGDSATPSSISTITGDTKVLAFELPASSDFLRLVAFKAKDSDIVVTDAIPEASAEGRKQHNQYIRGRADRPRLVLMQGSQDGTPKFRYYSLATGTSSPTAAGTIDTLLILKEVKYSSEATSYNGCQRLRQNYIDYTTARIMETYNDARAQSYYQKAASYAAV